jgi:thioredoxin-like negative regulator of GroEL
MGVKQRIRESMFAIFASLGVVALLGCDMAREIQELTVQPSVSEQLITALSTKDFETAEVLLARQVRERPDDGDLRFRLAMIQSEQGKTEEALDQMQLLVTTQRHKEAARWIVRNKYDKRKWSELAEAERDEFGSLTKLMFEKYPNDTSVKNLYADFLIASGDLPNALPVLRELSDIIPLRGLQAAAVARKLKLFEEADEIAERSLDAMTAISEEDPRNLSVSLAVAQNQLFLKRFTEAINTLDKAMKLTKSPQELKLARQAFGDAIVAFVAHIEDNSNGTVAERVRVLKILRVALKSAPKNPRVLTAISNKLRATPDAGNEQITALREAFQAALNEAMENADEGARAKPDEATPPAL